MNAETEPHLAQTPGNPNMIALLKNGASKLPLDRVPSMARALECGPPMLFKLALEQLGGDTTARAVEEIFGVVVTRNEAAWIEELRDGCGHSDPPLTTRGRGASRCIREVRGLAFWR